MSAWLPILAALAMLSLHATEAAVGASPAAVIAEAAFIERVVQRALSSIGAVAAGSNADPAACVAACLANSEEPSALMRADFCRPMELLAPRPAVAEACSRGFTGEAVRSGALAERHRPSLGCD